MVEPTDCLISEWYCLTNSSTKSQQLLIIFLSFYFLLNKSTSSFSSPYWKGGCVFWSPPIYFHTYFITPMCYEQNRVFPKAEMADVTSIVSFPVEPQKQLFLKIQTLQLTEWETELSKSQTASLWSLQGPSQSDQIGNKLLQSICCSLSLLLIMFECIQLQSCHHHGTILSFPKMTYSINTKHHYKYLYVEGLASPFFSLSYQMPSPYWGMRHLTNNCSSVALYKGCSKIKAAKKTQINWMVILTASRTLH